MRQRKAFIVYVNLDPVPGTFHTEESALNGLRSILTSWLGTYQPTVTYVSERFAPRTNDLRQAFVVFIDLDDVPGTMHSQESAQHVISNTLREAIGHYQPLVSLAPEPLQRMASGR